MGERVLIAGCGFVGTRLAHELTALDHEVWGLARSAPALPEGARWVAGDLTIPESLRLPTVDHVVFAASAGESTDERYHAVYVIGLANLLRALPSPPKRLCFVSSTAVYHQSNGEWVDETSPTHPTHFSGVRTLEAEGVARNADSRAVILRCAGIYGPGRTRLIDNVRRGSVRMTNDTRYTNRIHRDDVAGALLHLMFHPDPDAVYVGVDEYPAPEPEVHAFIAHQLGVTLNPAPDGETSPQPTGPKQRSAGNKRCDGSKLRASGYRFAFPTFREGYGAMLGDDSANAASNSPGFSSKHRRVT
jgi:nucleoside-diphosphate-sugar epimerase